MISYHQPLAKTEAAVDAQQPGTNRTPSWRKRASTAIAKSRAAGKYLGTGPDWSEIKDVFVRLQQGKCGFCEKRLEDGDLELHENVGAYEQDVEHFRPKKAVDDWQPHADLGFPVNCGNPAGYFALAYDLRNYLISCKTCNSKFKRNGFPIEGTQGKSNATDVANLNSKEQPLLVNPVDSQDVDPAKILTFQCVMPCPVAGDGRNRRRAQVVIQFFRLATRESLIRERFDKMTNIWRAFKDLSSANATEQTAAARDLKAWQADSAPHASMARAFVNLLTEAPQRAFQLYEASRRYCEENTWQPPA